MSYQRCCQHGFGAQRHLDDCGPGGHREPGGGAGAVHVRDFSHDDDSTVGGRRRIRDGDDDNRLRVDRDDRQVVDHYHFWRGRHGQWPGQLHGCAEHDDVAAQRHAPDRGKIFAVVQAARRPRLRPWHRPDCGSQKPAGSASEGRRTSDSRSRAPLRRRASAYAKAPATSPKRLRREGGRCVARHDARDRRRDSRGSRRYFTSGQPRSAHARSRSNVAPAAADAALRNVAGSDVRTAWSVSLIAMSASVVD